MIYLDQAATSFPKIKEVQDAVIDCMNHCTNANRSTSVTSLNASRLIYQTRKLIKEYFHVPQDGCVVLNSGNTESLNTCIKGILKKGDHVITTYAEHNSVLRPLYQLEKANIITLSITSPTVENIKKHLQGGVLFAQEGKKVTVGRKSSPRPVAHVGTSDPIALWGRTEQQTPPRELPEVTAIAPKITKPKLDQSTLYGWMMLNGFDSKDASFEGRKQLFQKIFGDVEYKGTASQNTKLLTALKTAGKRATDTDFVAGMNNLVTLKPSGIPKLK